MRYRRFGRSGLQVSELVFGGGWVGGLLIHQDDDTRRAAIERAVAAGINWIDTAPSYGQGRSEEALGWLIEGVEPAPRLSTKVRIDLDELADVSGQVERSVHESLERLRVDSVELLQLHNPIGTRSGRATIGVDDAMRVADALDELREQGLFSLTGITALGDAAACRRTIESGRFDSAQVYYNLLNPSAARSMPAAWRGHDFSGIVAACVEHDVAVMNIRVFAAGVLATDTRHGREVVITEDAELAIEQTRAAALARALGPDQGTGAQNAVRFSLSNADVSCVVVGLAELAHLEEALAAAEMGPLPEEALASIEQVYRSGFA